MADTRYLKKRRQTWYFNIKVPRDVQEQLGRSHITQTLETRDLSVAQKKRWELLPEYAAQFDVLRGKRDFTPAEIEERALKEFHAALKEYDEFGYEEGDYDDKEDRYVDGDLDFVVYSLESNLEQGDLSDLDYALTMARIQAAIARRHALNNQTFKIPKTFGRRAIDPISLQPYLRKSKGTGVKFSVAAKDFIEETQRDAAARLTEQTRGQYEAVYRLFTSWADNPTLDEVERARASEFLKLVSRLSPHWGRSPETKRRTFAQVFEEFGDHETGLSNRTINRYATALGAVWKWSKRRGLFSGENPWEEQQRRVGERRKTEMLPFNPDQLKALLALKPEVKPKKHGAAAALPWVSLISAYSGMRLNEICGLKTKDLKQEGGIHFFDVTNAKTEAGDRRIPVHSHILSAGLLEFAKHGDEWLFPNLKAGGPDQKRGWYLSRAFTTYRRNLGIVRLNPSTGKDQLNFHSFRRSAIKALEDARIPQTEAAQVVGHERAGITYGNYNPEGLSLKALRGVVEMISFPV